MRLALAVLCVATAFPSAFARADDVTSVNPKTRRRLTPAGTSKLQDPAARKQALRSAMQLQQPPAGPPTIPGNDDCSTPTPISGNGTFAFDSTGATTGPPPNPACGVVHKDIWFDWLCPTSGICTWSLCGAGYDSFIAVYAGSNCPAQGTTLACNDDSCGVESETQFPCTAGSHFLLQLGGYGATDAGSGTFTLSASTIVSNDDCSTPTAVSGLGSFPFDNTNATTGTQGQGQAQCAAEYGQPTIEHDVWFTWTAPASACTRIDTCGSSVDTKIAVYGGNGCPLLAPLDCNDDACGFQSVLSFTAIAGRTYSIQLGTSVGAIGGAGTFQISQVMSVPGNDDCATPTQITGQGTFAFDNTNATAGCEGQHEQLCGLYGAPSIDKDVWFEWVAPLTGIADWDTCGLTTIQPRMAVYQGAGCPTPGSALACLGTGCPGGQATLFWNCTAGTTYTLQLGTYGFSAGGAGTFSLNVYNTPANDDCNTPVVLGPSGPYPFSLISATTSPQGQTSCAAQYGQNLIEHDVWYTWNCPSTGRATLSTCGTTTVDTKVAVYAGTGCPTATSLACDDDACGFQSEVCFDVVGGQAYTIQLGTFPGATTGTGTFDILLQAALPPCTYDDGSPENLLTWTTGGDMVWLNRFGTSSTTTVLDSVDVLWGSVLFAGHNPGNGTPTDVFVWEDGPSQDGDPSDASLLLTIPTTVSLVDTDTYVHFPIAPLTISGVFFVGCHQDNYGLFGAGPTQYVAPMDQNCAHQGVAWFFGNNSGFGTSPVDYAHPSNNVQPPITFDSIGLPCQVCVRAGCSTRPVTYLCDPGTAGVIACPCANPPTGLTRGCNNSAHTGGASITASGLGSLASPTLAFTTANETPIASSVLLQGNAGQAGGVPFGQGVRCVAGHLTRLFVKLASAGSILAPNFGAGDPSLPARSAALGDPINVGEDRWYVVYYRDPVVLGSCPSSSTFNTTNTARVSWQP
jgi:hypothetical protein